MSRSLRLRLACSVCLLTANVSALQADDALLRDKVKSAIARAQQYLISQQLPNGSWSGDRAGANALVFLALATSGLAEDDPAIRKGLEYLRDIDQPGETYDAALMIMAFASVNQGKADRGRMARLAKWLEDSQLRGGHSGAWGYGRGQGGWYDNSNTQYAVLGMREAQQSGAYEFDRATWRRARDHWLRVQVGNREGVGGAGWGYGEGDGGTTGSMTVAGIASLTIAQSFLRDDPPGGELNCCGADEEDETQEAIDAGARWMGAHFQIRNNPGSGAWPLYYLYGLERAGRLSGRRFFGDHDWYREGAQFLVETQTAQNGTWRSSSHSENNPVIGTSFALLFLAKGLAPVLVNKLKFGPRDPASGEPLSEDWNHHDNDVRNLVESISMREGWPHLLTWQVVDLDKAAAEQDVQSLLQAPVQLLSGRDDPRSIDGEQLELLRDYISQGGFVLAVQNCDGGEFDAGFRELIKRLFPTGEFRLRRLADSHDVYRSEFLMTENPPELWGVDLGCRTAIMYAPFDHACRWDHWLKSDPPGRNPALKATISKSVQLGTNIIAYATNREVHDKLEGPAAIVAGEESAQGRGSLRIARLRHSGGWDTARNALRHLYDALDKKVGLQPAVRTVNLPATDPTLLEYPLLYMHGRQTFSFSPAEREKLQTHLKNGGLLFADACCGAEAFDTSFRQLVDQIFGKPLGRIPIEHELFQSEWGYDIRQVDRRLPAGQGVLDTEMSRGEPILEGIEIDGRLAVIYSKYDISCALERQATAACAGYTSEDATRIAVNIVLYSFLQQLDATSP